MFKLTPRLLLLLSTAFSGFLGADCSFEQRSLEKKGTYYILSVDEVGPNFRQGTLSDSELSRVVGARKPTFECIATEMDGWTATPGWGTNKFGFTARGYSKVSCISIASGLRWNPYKLPKPFEIGTCSTAYMFTPWEVGIASRFFAIPDSAGTLQVFDNFNRTKDRSDGFVFENPSILTLLKVKPPFSPKCSPEPDESAAIYKNFDMHEGLHAPLTFRETPSFSGGSLFTNKKNRYSVPTYTPSSISQCKNGYFKENKVRLLTNYQVLDTIFELVDRRFFDNFTSSDILALRGLPPTDPTVKRELRGSMPDYLLTLGLDALQRHRQFFLVSSEIEGPFSDDGASDETERLKTQPDF